MLNQKTTDATLGITETSNLEKIIEFKRVFPVADNAIRNKLLGILDLDKISGDDIEQLKKYFDVTKKEVMTLIKHHIYTKKIIEVLDCYPKTEYEFVEAYLSKFNIKMDYHAIFTMTKPLQYDGVIIDEERFQKMDSKMRYYIKSDCHQRFDQLELNKTLLKFVKDHGLKFNETEIQNALNYYVLTTKKEIEKSIKIKLIHDKKVKCDKEWKALANAICDTNIDETVLVLQHFVWQVKRKMFGKPVDYHMMPVLYTNKHGVGKSMFIKIFNAPLDCLVAACDFAKVVDPREFNIWKYSVLVFDEMATADRHSIDVIKNRITNDNFTVRALYTNDQVVIINESTMIGSSNIDLSNIIIDKTGMRRFYQIDCKDSFDHDVINKTDYYRLWQSVDEDAESPLLQNQQFFNNVKKHQHSKRNMSDIECFLRHYPNTERISSNELWNDFKDYLYNHAPGSVNKFRSTYFFKSLMSEAKNIDGLKITKFRSNGTFYSIIK